MRGLVVDPEPLSRNMMRVALERIGIVCEGFADLAHAEAALKTREFDVVVVDGALPSEGGLNLLRRLRRGRWRGSCVYTAELVTDAQMQELSREIAPRAIFMKPLNFAEVETRLARAIPGAQPGLVHDEAHVPASWSGALRKSRNEFAQRLARWVEELAVAAETAQSQRSGKHAAEARRLAASLAEECRKQAFPIVAETAEAVAVSLDEVLAGRRDIGSKSLWDRVETLLKVMDASLPETATAISTVATDQFEKASTRVLAVASDLDLLRKLADFSERHDIGLLTARSIKEAVRISIRRKFDAALLTEGLPDGGTSLLTEWLRRQPGLSEMPIALMVPSGNDAAQSANAARAQGARFAVPLPIDENAFVAAIARLTKQRARRPARVVLIDDDPEFGEGSRLLFAKHGLTLIYLPSAAGLVQRLDEIRPDLIVADVVLPIISGIEICRQVRAAPDWSTVPVLLTTTQDTPSLRVAAYRAGADGVLNRPLQDDEFVTRVLTTIERMRALRETDPTGALTRAAFLSATRDAFGDGQKALAGALFDVDFFHEINSAYGIAAGDRVLSGVVASIVDVLADDAIVGRWGSDQIAVSIPGESRSGAITRLTRVAQKIRAMTFQSGSGKRFQVSVQLGVSATDRTGANLETLLREVETNLRTAKKARG